MTNAIEALEKLQALRASGALTEAEFETEKARVLGMVSATRREAGPYPSNNRIPIATEQLSPAEDTARHNEEVAKLQQLWFSLKPIENLADAEGLSFTAYAAAGLIILQALLLSYFGPGGDLETLGLSGFLGFALIAALILFLAKRVVGKRSTVAAVVITGVAALQALAMIGSFDVFHAWGVISGVSTLAMTIQSFRAAAAYKRISAEQASGS